MEENQVYLVSKCSRRRVLPLLKVLGLSRSGGELEGVGCFAPMPNPTVGMDLAIQTELSEKLGF